MIGPPSWWNKSQIRAENGTCYEGRAAGGAGILANNRQQATGGSGRGLGTPHFGAWRLLNTPPLLSGGWWARG